MSHWVSRSTTSLMRKRLLGKVPMPQSVYSITIYVPMPNRKTISCFMLTIVLGRIRTTASSTTCCTLYSWVRRSQLFYHSCFQVTQSLHLTGILALSRRHTGGQGWTPWGALLVLWNSHRWLERIQCSWCTILSGKELYTSTSGHNFYSSISKPYQGLITMGCRLCKNYRKFELNILQIFTYIH